MNKIGTGVTLLFFLSTEVTSASQDSLRIRDSVINALDFALIQYSHAIQTTTDSTKFPRTNNTDGTVKTVSASDWTSGFFPGVLWLLYEYSGDREWRKNARRWTASLSSQQYHSGDHDIGFIINSSFGNGWRLTRNPLYKPVIVQAGYTFRRRYNDTVQCTKSWDWFKPYPVIMDNLMNLELFWKAFAFTGDTIFNYIPRKHALRTAGCHIRPDSSTYHVVDFDRLTGLVTWKGTRQGYSDSSCWSRGQAWGIYGYIMMYEYSGDSVFLEISKQLAGYYLSHLPANGIPYYDFDAPLIPDEPLDASSAAITASALIKLYKATRDTFFLRHAENMLANLASPLYTAPEDSNAKFIIMHTTGGKDYNVDKPVNYADYYYIEALLNYLYLDTGWYPANHPPELLSPAPDTVIAGMDYQFRLQTFDFDGDSIICSAVNLPQGLNMHPDGTISGIADSSGLYPAEVVLSDGITADTFQISVFVEQLTANFPSATDACRLAAKVIVDDRVCIYAAVNSTIEAIEVFTVTGTKVLNRNLYHDKYCFTPAFQGLFFIKTVLVSGNCRTCLIYRLLYLYHSF